MALMWSQANYAFPHTYMPSIQTEVNTAERTLVLVCAIQFFACMQKSGVRYIIV